MLSNDYKFIYIHVPKTGGTSIQEVFLPYSDDEKYLLPFQDGKDSFEIKGPVTPNKHATLQDYYDLLGDDLKNYKIIVSVRHPIGRAVSGYFSPHKWVFKQKNGSWAGTEPFWDEEKFIQLVNMPNHMPASDYLKVNGHFQPPDIVVRHGNFEDDLRACVKALNLPFDIAESLPKLNASAASSGLFFEVLRRAEVRKIIAEKYGEDLKNFGYDLGDEL